MQHYDVAVLGRGAGSLVACIMLARSGRRVAWVEHDPPALDMFEPLFFAGEGSVIEQVHATLGLTDPLVRQPQDRPVWHYILPQHWLAVRGGRAALVTELEHEFAADRAPLQDLWQRIALMDRAVCTVLNQAPSLPPETLAHRWALWRLQRAQRALHRPADTQAINALFGSLPATHPVRRLLLAPQALWSGRALSACSLGMVVHRMAQMFLGSPLAAPDRATLRAQLVEAAKKAGVTLLRGSRARRLVGRGKEALELQLDEAGRTLGASHYLYGGVAPLETLSEHPGDRARHSERTRAANLGARWLRYTLDVPTDRLSQALGPWTCLLETEPAHTDGVEDFGVPLLLQRGKADGAMTPLTVYLPRQARADSVDLTQVWRTEAMPRVQRLLPFAPLTGACGSTLGLDDDAQTSAKDRGLWGVGGPSRRTRFRNVFECGPRVMPGLGLEGEYVSALGAVRLVTRRPLVP